MTKKRSKSLFVLFAIILVICLFACFVNFTYPFSVGGNYYSYSSFVSNMKLGEDVGNSLRIVYNAKAENEAATNYNNLRTHTMDSLKDIVSAEGFKDVSVTEYGEDGIVLTVGNILTEDDKNSIISLVGNPATISFSKNSDGKDPFTKYENIKSVTAMDYNNQGTMEYYVVVEFKDEYKSEIVSISKENDIYVFLGTQQFLTINKDNLPEDGKIYLQNESFKSVLDATTIANQIKAGMLSLELTQIQCDEITPSYGRAASVWLSVALIVLTIAVFAYLIVKFKQLGWLTTFAMLFFIVISLFLLQSIPLVHINFAGFIAMALCLIVLVDNCLDTFETAKKYYQADKKLSIAIKMALKECLSKTLISNALLMLVGFACLFMPSLSIQSFGWVAFVLPIVSVFTTQALMRLFLKMYLAINHEDGKKCNFHKGGKNA